MPWDFADELRKYGPDAGDRPLSLPAARAYCAGVTKSHYENFTVASWLLPRSLVPHFQAVYAYCRWADDLADETGGGASALGLLDWWRSELMECYGGAESISLRDGPSTSRRVGNSSPRGSHPVLIALRETIRTFAIPPEPFLNLLAAFEQDQRFPKYDTFDQLLGYCENSANPVGHLVLYLFECFDDRKAILSDDICTGLQLANFWQDVARDFDKGRIYLPREDRARFGVTEEQLAAKRFDPAFRTLILWEVQRTRVYFEHGRALLPRLPREARVDVELFAAGGEAVLRAIEKRGGDVLTSRPRIGRLTKAKLLGRALLGQLFG